MNHQNEWEGLDLTGVSLVLVRGAQGAGKSTFARWLAEAHGFIQLEPDDYYHAGPHYFWERARLKLAHDWNRWRTYRALCAGHKVVVAETFYEARFLHPYLAMTPHHRVFRATGEFQNVHSVPEEVVAEVRARMEPYPGEEFLK